MRNLTISLLTTILLCIAGVSALTCDRTVLDNNNPSMLCSNPDNLSVSVSKYGNYFTLLSSIIPSNSNQTISISVDTSAPNGNLGVLTFSNSSLQIPVNNNQTQQSTCQINPSLVAYSQVIQTGTSTVLPKIVFDPINCPSSLVLTGSNVYVLGGITTSQGQKPISIQSVVSDGVILKIDTSGLTSQTYLSTLYINAFGKSFQIPFNIIVTSGTSVSGNFSTNNLPVCSVTNTMLNLNATYTLVCSNIVPDVRIVPRVDSKYIIGKTVDTTTSQYMWYFSPIAFGNTIIYADFYYRDAPVGTPFSQELRISSSGVVTPGTELAFQFTPTLEFAKPGDRVIINLIDNKSKSLVSNAEIFVDAVPLNTIDGVTFNYTFVMDKEYSMRGRAYGYSDIVITAKLLSKPLNISISPTSGDEDTTFTITPSSINASLFIDGTKTINNTYIGVLIEGVHELKAIQNGYYDAIINITVGKALRVLYPSDLKRNVESVLILSKNASWNVLYKEDLSSIGKNILGGQSDRVIFTPKDVGVYQIVTSTGTVVWTQELKGWDGKILWFHWIYWVIGLVVIVIAVLVMKNKSEPSLLPYGGSVNTT